MLTNSCVKLQTVHTIPMSVNKEGMIRFTYCMFKDLIPVLSVLYFISAQLFPSQMMNLLVYMAS